MKKINITADLFEFRNYILEDLFERGFEYIAREKMENSLLILVRHSRKGGCGILT